jgi:hypothetical protein
MRILTYKRTHIGDPDQYGVFGSSDCMGQVRNFQFDAVIGIGGVGWEPQSHGIDRRLNWVGFGLIRQSGGELSRGDVVHFEHFKLMESNGPLLTDLAPSLARRFYKKEKPPRFLLDGYTEDEHAEALTIIEWASSNGRKLVNGQRMRIPTFVPNILPSEARCAPTNCRPKPCANS